MTAFFNYTAKTNRFDHYIDPWNHHTQSVWIDICAYVLLCFALEERFQRAHMKTDAHSPHLGEIQSSLCLLGQNKVCLVFAALDGIRR